MGLKQALERYERATTWMDAANAELIKEHYDNYLEVIEDVRVAFDDHIKNTLGYNPYTNYEDLLKELL